MSAGEGVYQELIYHAGLLRFLTLPECYVLAIDVTP